MIVGIDEVGRGAWAGPLAVGAVVLGDVTVQGLTDSKKLTKKQRERLNIEIRQKARDVGIGWVSAKMIDRIGLSAALKLAARRAVDQLRTEYHEIIIDGTIDLLGDPRVTLLKKADLLIPSVSAASIVAKVARDNYMKHLDAVFPGYKFTSHVGYGTAAHQKAIKQLGASPVHRLSFEPLRQPKEKVTKVTTYKTTKQVGDAAEALVAAHLVQHNHTIVSRNWRTKFCEIDIVSKYGDTMYFTEVKYRQTATYGDGMAAITPKKLDQMRFAAELYVARYGIEGDVRLAVAAVCGQPPRVTEFLEID